MSFGLTAYPQINEKIGDFGGALAQGIKSRLERAQAEKAEKEIPYAGLASLADVLSKSAYASSVIPQYQSKLAGNRQIWSNMTPSQQAVAVQMASSPGTVGNTGGGSLTPIIQKAMEIYDQQNQPQDQSQSGILSSISNLLKGNSDNKPTTGQNPGLQLFPQSQISQQNPTIQENNSQLQLNSGLPNVPQNLGDQSPAMQNEANYASQQKQAEASGSAMGAQSANQLENAQKISNGAQQMDQLIDSAVDKYKKSFLKGPGLGKLAKYGPDAAQALKDTNNMAVAMADQLFGTNSTDAKQAAATTLKLNMEDPEKAFNEFAQKMKAQNDRFKWQGTFYQTTQGLGVTNPTERDQLWFDYNAKHPPYDYKNHKPIYDNLGLDQAGMVKFITQDRANAKLMNKRIESTLKRENEVSEKPGMYAQTPEEWHGGKAAEASKTVNGKRMLKIGGQWYEEGE